jgi:hypothetical protein
VDVKSKNAYTPLKALQALYDLAMDMTLSFDPDRLNGRDPKTAAAVEKVRLHYGLKEFKPK